MKASAAAGQFWAAASSPEAKAALELTFEVAGAASRSTPSSGTLIAWVLVRDDFPGSAIVEVVIDLPFALPTIVAGLTLLSLYGRPAARRQHRLHQAGVLGAAVRHAPVLVRAVQPVMRLDREMEDAAASLGAGRLTTVRRIVFPNLLPRAPVGRRLAFARALGEFGAVVLIAGNMPFKTEIASVYIFQQFQRRPDGRRRRSLCSCSSSRSASWSRSASSPLVHTP